MKLRHQIPFHINKEKTFTIFYDDEEKLFYRKYTKVNTNPIYLYTGITATLSSYLLSGVSYKLFSSVFFLPVFISFLLAVIIFAITIYLAEKNFDKNSIHYFDILDEDYLYTLIVEGERSLRLYIITIIGIFIVTIGVMVALLVNSNDFVLFLCHTLFWWVFLILIFTGNVFKRKRLYLTLRRKLAS